MADKGTTGDLEGQAKDELAKLGERLKSATLDLAGDAIALTEDQLKDFASLADDVALAIGGDERAKVHVEAQLALQKFTDHARAYLALAEFRRAFADAILAVVSNLATAGAQFAGEALAGLLTGALDDLG